MAKYYVAAVRDWDEDRMMANFEHVTEIGSGYSFITADYKTVRGLVKYRIQEHPVYYSHVWAVFDITGGNERFIGLEYNLDDSQLRDVATRYMMVRNRLRHSDSRTSGYPLSVRA